ncbi:Crp/Fnr family transcription regulator (fragment) [Candidatus Filomicrobium marinum]|uniref:Crp/Fnr family transcription regulator n=2 Tax=Filomicrobium TaxID=119044 RepID=A0A0D6JDG5_9HYPH
MTDVPFDFGFFEKFLIPLKRFRAGEKIFQEGEAGQAMYVVLEGKVDITLGQTVLETVGLHGIFGEMALIEHALRSADAIAKAATEVAVIDTNAFVKLVSNNPHFSLYVMRQMASRVRRMNTRL